MGQQTTTLQLSAKSIVEISANLPDDFQNAAEYVTVMFADLVGSTAYKQNNDPIDGVLRTYRHNQVASKHITAHSGFVVKHIGDAVMGLFHGDGHQDRAIRAGLDVILDFHSKQGRSKDAKIETRIGVHSGKAWFIRYSEGGIPDPLGFDVDKAAHVQNLADPQQLICTEATFEGLSNALRTDSTLSIGSTCERFLKGIEERVPLRMIRPSSLGQACEVPWLGHDRTTPVHLIPHLNEALSLIGEDSGQSCQTAFKRFKYVVEGSGDRKESGDEFNFMANLHLAQLAISDRLTPAFLADQGVTNRLEFAFKCFCRAKQIRRDFAPVWLGLGWIRFQWWSTKQEVSIRGRIDTVEEHLKYAISNTERALADAQARYDYDCLARAQIQLAEFHVLSHDLNSASEWCETAERHVDGVFEHDRLRHRIVKAMILMRRGGSGAKLIESIVFGDDDRRKLERELPVIEFRADLARCIRDGLVSDDRD